MAGYWPSSFLFCVFMDRDGVEVHKHAKKQNQIIDVSCYFWGVSNSTDQVPRCRSAIRSETIDWQG